MREICELIVYSNTAAIPYLVEVTIEDFQERLAKALEDGTVVLDTVEGSKLILNAINVVAIEIRKPTSIDESVNNIPPVEKI